MGKISPVSSKYIVHASIQINGIVDKPDVIGAIFGQTEGLLGAELELRELQRSGRIGRIEVNVETKTGKSKGEIIIPSSLDKAETAIVAAALEIIQRIGPCNAKIKVENIEDVRISKRQAVVGEKVIQNMKKMYDAGLVHGDLSEYNILIHNNTPYFIDFSQGTTKRDPNYDEYWLRDIRNVSKFLSNKLKLKISEDDIKKKIGYKVE